MSNVIYKYDNFSVILRPIEDDVRWTSGFREVKEHNFASFGFDKLNSTGHRLTSKTPVTGKKVLFFQKILSRLLVTLLTQFFF